jgi:hypothetical protein
MLDAMTSAPAFVANGRADIVAANRLGHALYSEAFLDPRRPVNLARFHLPRPTRDHLPP